VILWVSASQLMHILLGFLAAVGEALVFAAGAAVLLAAASTAV
jgi:hypothetical protein